MRNWGELKNAVLDHLGRRNDARAREQLPTWLATAEGLIFNTLRAGWMIRYAKAIILSERDTVPPSMLQVVAVNLLSETVSAEELERLGSLTGYSFANEIQAAIDAGLLTEERPSPYVIRALEPLGMGQLPAESLHEGPARYYRIEGHSIRIVPWPGKPIKIEFGFYSRGRDITKDERGQDSDAGFNETLHHLPNVYLYGMLYAASVFYGRDGSSYLAQMQGAIEAANRAAYDYMGTGFTARFRRRRSY